MKIILYYNKSESIKVDKDIEEVLTVEGTFRTRVSILNPTIYLNIDFIPLNINYVYIEDLKRYYYVDNIIADVKDMYILKCSIDVLMTYKNYIKSQQAYVSRNQYVYNGYISDNYMTFLPSKVIEKDEVSIGNDCLKFNGYSAPGSNIAIVMISQKSD